MADFGWIGNIVGAVGTTATAAITAKAQKDALNKQGEINDKGYAYSIFSEDQKTDNLIKIVIVLAVVVVIGLVVLMIVKKKVT